MKRKLLNVLCGGVLVFLPLFSAQALDLVIKTTADETKLGFTEGQVVTFTFTVNPLFVNTAESAFSGGMGVWGAMGTDAPIFSWVGITGVGGSFNPVIGVQSNSSLTVNNQGAMTVDTSYESLGYTADGQSIMTLAGSFALPDPDFFDVPSEYVDPTAYFLNYQGIFPIENFGFGLLVNPDEPDFITFTATELQVVPEPGSLILFSAGACAAIWMRRRLS